MDDINFDEVNESQFPAIDLLVRLGWKYVTRDEAEELRGGDKSRVILTDITKNALMRINSYEENGIERKFDKNDIAAKVDELENIKVQGLIDTSKEVSNRIMPKLGGGTIKVFENGSYQDKSIRYIDFDNIENNDFHVTVEYKINGNEENFRPDIMLFINGIPIAEIENKRGSVGFEKAIAQLRRYQQKEYSPKLYTFVQLLIAMDNLKLEHSVYGTAGTPAEYYTHWREKDQDQYKLEQTLSQILYQPLEQETYNKIRQDLNGYVLGLRSTSYLPQDNLIYGMLRKERILDIIKNFVFYDGLYKKVARYQQYFAVKKMLNQVKQREGEHRKGGIIWHTQGSGKSLTMVMFVRALIEDPEIKNPRIVIVTDRIDLDKQIKETFANGGLKKDVIRTTSGEDLIKRIKNKDPNVLTTIIDKFNSAAKKYSKVVDEDENIFVLVDEAHRSQSGDANLSMLRTIPNACYIAFTGTPILKNQKKLTTNKFGDFIDRYTIDDALKDGIIVPLLYDGRYIPIDEDEDKIDRKVERVLSGLSDEQQEELKKRIEKKHIKNTSAKIEEVCIDVAEHFERNFQNTGLKAQLVAPNKISAVHMHEWFERDGRIKTALVISDENGEIGDEEKEKQEVKTYLDKIKQNYASLRSYEDQVIADFKTQKSPEILIVVDKLLTGFDAPVNTVLYLAKQLRDHNLLQAIARVNRLYNNENGTMNKTAGYVVDYSENARAIKEAMALFGNYDPDDVRSALIDVKQKKGELEASYAELVDLFKEFKTSHECLDSLKDEAERRKFYDSYNKVLNIYSEYANLREADTELIGRCQKDLKKFAEIKKDANILYDDKLDLRAYERELVRILDQHITADQATILVENVEISNSKYFDQAVEQLGSGKSRAEAIAAQANRRITEAFKNKGDVNLFNKFSEKIRRIIDELYDNKIEDSKAFEELTQIIEDIDSRKDNSLPEKIKDIAGGGLLYGNLKELISENDYDNHIIKLAEIVKQYAIVDWWKSFDQKRIMENAIDDYIYDNLEVNEIENKKIRSKIIELAENNYDLFKD